MSKFARTLRFVLVLAACCAWQASATTYRLMSPSQVILDADLIFLGTVADIVVENRSGEPWTVVTFRIDELVRGFGFDPEALDAESDTESGQDTGSGAGQEDDQQLVPETVTLAFLGGSTAGAELLVSGAPTWRFDAEYLVAAYEQEGLASPVVGFRQGLWHLGDDGPVDLDGMALAVADDGALARSLEGATLSQVLRAVHNLLTGRIVPGETGSAAGRALEATEPAESPAAEGAGTEAVPEEPADVEAAPADAVAPAASPEVANEAPRVAALHVDYDVDDSGGPLLLSDKVDLAVAAWSDAVGDLVDLSVERTADSRNLVRYGREELFGPSTLSLTTVAQGAGTRGGAVTALIAPTSTDLTHTVLVHELGVLLGLAEGEVGVMASAIAAPLIAPTEADVAELAALSLYLPADLTRDGQVDFYDLLALAAAYGESGINVLGDLDGNGVVDSADVDELRQSYQFEQPR